MERVEFDDRGIDRDKPIGLIILKPHGYRIKNQILAFLRGKNIEIKLDSIQLLDRERIQDHYSTIPERYFDSITQYLEGSKTSILLVQPSDSLSFAGLQEFLLYLRRLTGNSSPAIADRDSIRGLGNSIGLPSYIVYQRQDQTFDWCIDNFVHCSAKPDELLREINVWFPDSNLTDYIKSLMEGSDNNEQ